MSILGIVLLVLVLAVVCGGFYGGPTAGVGYYPRSYGLGVGGVILVVLFVLFLLGRL